MGGFSFQFICMDLLLYRSNTNSWGKFAKPCSKIFFRTCAIARERCVRIPPSPLSPHLFWRWASAQTQRSSALLTFFFFVPCPFQKQRSWSVFLMAKPGELPARLIFPIRLFSHTAETRMPFPDLRRI